MTLCFYASALSSSGCCCRLQILLLDQLNLKAFSSKCETLSVKMLQQMLDEGVAHVVQILLSRASPAAKTTHSLLKQERETKHEQKHSCVLPPHFEAFTSLLLPRGFAATSKQSWFAIFTLFLLLWTFFSHFSPRFFFSHRSAICHQVSTLTTTWIVSEWNWTHELPGKQQTENEGKMGSGQSLDCLKPVMGKYLN